MNPAKSPNSLLVPIVMECIAWAGVILSLLVYLRFANNGFWGDDWPLLADAIRGASPIEPVSAHIRPIVRLHFLLYHLSQSPLFFHLAQLGLHIAVGMIGYFSLRPSMTPPPDALLHCFSSQRFLRTRPSIGYPRSA